MVFLPRFAMKKLREKMFFDRTTGYTGWNVILSGRIL